LRSKHKEYFLNSGFQHERSISLGQDIPNSESLTQSRTVSINHADKLAFIQLRGEEQAIPGRKQNDLILRAISPL